MDLVVDTNGTARKKMQAWLARYCELTSEVIFHQPVIRLQAQLSWSPVQCCQMHGPLDLGVDLLVSEWARFIRGWIYWSLYGWDRLICGWIYWNMHGFIDRWAYPLISARIYWSMNWSIEILMHRLIHDITYKFATNQASINPSGIIFPPPPPQADPPFYYSSKSAKLRVRDMRMILNLKGYWPVLFRAKPAPRYLWLAPSTVD